jgi:hypothetical protein
VAVERSARKCAEPALGRLAREEPLGGRRLDGLAEIAEDLGRAGRGGRRAPRAVVGPERQDAPDEAGRLGHGRAEVLDGPERQIDGVSGAARRAGHGSVSPVGGTIRF